MKNILFLLIILISFSAAARDGRLGDSSTGVEYISITITPHIDITQAAQPTMENIQTACLNGSIISSITVDGKKSNDCTVIGAGLHEVMIIAK